MYSRRDLEKIERAQLMPYACFSEDASRSGVIKHPTRTEFQRDRDRILHSKAFRRLEYKTQVFLTDKGDHLRTRLTHSLEVAQLSRTIAIQLGLNQDLVEAISLGHDLGHTPFGHAGERELIRLLALENVNCFKHNAQSVRIVEILEKKYPYDGLRLTLATKEGILKHTRLPSDTPSYCKDLFPEKPFSVTLEGQIVAIADEIAQITHDLDDYLRYNILEFSKMLEHELFVEVQRFYIDEYNTDLSKVIEESQDSGRLKDTIIRCLVDFLITLLVGQSSQMLNDDSRIKPYELDKVYISYYGKLQNIVIDFKKHLERIVFEDYRIKEMDSRGINIVNKLFNHFKEIPDAMPDTTYQKYLMANKDERLLVITDYISGMTDRYALDTYNSVFGLPDNSRERI